MISVWSRVATGSMTVVSPSAKRPAIRIADFTCALATGSVYSMPRREPPSMVAGRVPPSASTTLAPMRASGSAMRSMGRRRSDASPSMRQRDARAAPKPASSRAVVPELPASMSNSACSELGSTMVRPSGIDSTKQPIARRACTVVRTSRESERPSITWRPRAAAPRMSARCEIDLSPGTLRMPSRRAAWWTVRFMAGGACSRWRDGRWSPGFVQRSARNGGDGANSLHHLLEHLRGQALHAVAPGRLRARDAPRR